MKFNEGDTVMHWTYGLGQIIRLEERNLSGLNTIYYAVQIRDRNRWMLIENMPLEKVDQDLAMKYCWRFLFDTTET